MYAPAGGIEIWMVEMFAKNQLLRGGWTGDEFRPGHSGNGFLSRLTIRAELCGVSKILKILNLTLPEVLAD